MNYGFEEHPSRAALIASALFGGLAGIIAATLAFLVATAFFVMIADAFPSLTGAPALAVYVVLLLVPAIPLAGIMKTKEARFGPRVMSVVGLMVLAILSAGEVSGLLLLYPRNLHFYIVPGPDYGGSESLQSAANFNNCKEDALGYEKQSDRFRAADKFSEASRQSETTARMLEKCVALAPPSKDNHWLMVGAAYELCNSAAYAHDAREEDRAVGLARECSAKLQERSKAFTDLDDADKSVAQEWLKRGKAMTLGNWPSL